MHLWSSSSRWITAAVPVYIKFYCEYLFNRFHDLFCFYFLMMYALGYWHYSLLLLDLYWYLQLTFYLFDLFLVFISLSFLLLHCLCLHANSVTISKNKLSFSLLFILAFCVVMSFFFSSTATKLWLMNGSKMKLMLSQLICVFFCHHVIFSLCIWNQTVII